MEIPDNQAEALSRFEKSREDWARSQGLTLEELDRRNSQNPAPVPLRALIERDQDGRLIRLAILEPFQDKGRRKAVIRCITARILSRLFSHQSPVLWTLLSLIRLPHLLDEKREGE